MAQSDVRFDNRNGDSDPMMHAGVTRRAMLAAVATLGVGSVLAACGGNTATDTDMASPTRIEATQSPEVARQTLLIDRAANGLLSMGESRNGGTRFKSAIQAPNYHTDQDVGAASAGRGFLVMAEARRDDGRWLDAAKQTAAWLTSVSLRDNYGRYWLDHNNENDDNNTQNASIYTSYDDGTLGITDFYWELYEATQDDSYKAIALEGLDWTLARAENVATNDKPKYRWPWDVADAEPTYQMGMGMGAVGSVHTLALYYDRLKDIDPDRAAECKTYIDGAVRYIESNMAALSERGGDRRALPETDVMAGQDGNTNMNAGYLSGGAGLAFMYLKLHDTFGGDGSSKYLTRAEQTLAWLADEASGPLVRVGNDAVTWRLAYDPDDLEGGNDERNATGFEEGNAGIGWVYLQAYKVTGEKQYLRMAQQAANWLGDEAREGRDGALSWYENSESDVVHANLNNGAAGIGMFLYDLYVETNDERYLMLAKGAQTWLQQTALPGPDGMGVHWKDHSGDGGEVYEGDPSWHWGNAGIIAFLARMEGGTYDVPGMQPALRSRR